MGVAGWACPDTKLELNAVQGSSSNIDWEPGGLEAWMTTATGAPGCVLWESQLSVRSFHSCAGCFLGIVLFDLNNALRNCSRLYRQQSKISERLHKAA